MSAAVSTTRLRDVRITGWLLNELTRRWPALVDGAISVANEHVSPQLASDFRELAAVDRFHMLRLFAYLALCRSVDRGKREWTPRTLEWLARSHAEAKATAPPMPPLPPELCVKNGRTPTLTEGGVFILAALTRAEIIEGFPLRRDIEEILEGELAALEQTS